MSAPPDHENALRSLEDLAWLHSLARRIVADDALALDLTQDAAVIALERRAGRPPRAWLAGVLRNLVRQRHRADARRARAERIGASDRASGSGRATEAEATADVVARAELEQRLLDAVVATSEPGRTALLLRYREGLAPREIAARLDVPLATAKSRIARALADLRRRLDDDRTSGGRAALAPLAALARPALDHAARDASASLLMTKSLVAAAGTAVVLAAILLRGSNPAGGVPADVGPRDPGRDLVAVPSAVQDRSDPGTHESRTVGQVESVDGDRRFLVRGRVAEFETGRVLTDGIVVASHRTPAGAVAAATMPIEGDGRFTLTFVPDTFLLEVVVPPSPGHAGGRAQVDTFCPAGGLIDDLEVLVALGTSLGGVVIDGGGARVPGARVRAWLGDDGAADRTPERSVVADHEGRFRVEHVDGAVRLVADGADGSGLVARAGLVGSWRARGDEHRRDAELHVAPGADLFGRVTDERGRPVPGATLELQAATASPTPVAGNGAPPPEGLTPFVPAQRPTTSGADGRYTMRGVPPGTWPLFVRHDEYAPWLRAVEVSSGPSGPHDVALSRGADLSGRVIDPNGRSVPGARVRLMSGGRSERVATTDGDGSFRFGGLDADSWCTALVAVPRDGSGLADDVFAWEVVPTGATVELRLRRGATLRGVVVDAAGEPAPGCAVRIAGERRVRVAPASEARPEIVHRNAATRSDGEGRFTIEGLLPGAFEVSARRADGSVSVCATLVLDEGSSEEHVLTLPRSDGYLFAGRVVDDTTGRPVARFTVERLPSGGGSRTSVAVVSSDGEFAIELPAEAPVELEVVAEGYASARWSASPEDDDAGATEVRLVPIVSLQLALTERAIERLGDDVAVASFETREGEPIGGVAPQPLVLRGTAPATVRGVPARPLRIVVSSGIVDGTWREWSVDVDPTEVDRLDLMLEDPPIERRRGGG